VTEGHKNQLQLFSSDCPPTKCIAINPQFGAFKRTVYSVIRKILKDNTFHFDLQLQVELFTFCSTLKLA